MCKRETILCLKIFYPNVLVFILFRLNKNELLNHAYSTNLSHSEKWFFVETNFAIFLHFSELYAS